MMKKHESATFLHIPSLLDARQLGMLEKALQNATFQSGKLTAGMAAQAVKNNLQLDTSQLNYQQLLEEIILKTLYNNPLFQSALFPQKVYPPVLSKYEPGMTYGWHTDSPVMMANMQPVRTDLAMTLFLSDPGTYEGGELVLQLPSGEVSYKLDRGDAIFYPATVIHKVAEVTQGQRLAVVTWIQSALRNSEQREILFNLQSVHRRLIETDIHSQEAAIILQTYSNLFKMWVEI